MALFLVDALDTPALLVLLVLLELPAFLMPPGGAVIRPTVPIVPIVPDVPDVPDVPIVLHGHC